LFSSYRCSKDVELLNKRLKEETDENKIKQIQRQISSEQEKITSILASFDKNETLMDIIDTIAALPKIMESNRRFLRSISDNINNMLTICKDDKRVLVGFIQKARMKKILTPEEYEAKLAAEQQRIRNQMKLRNRKRKRTQNKKKMHKKKKIVN